MTLNIIADENIPALEHYFGALGEVRRVNGRSLQAHQLADADVLLVRSVTTVDEALLQGSRVRFVGTATSGLDHIDQAYLRETGTGFAYAAGSNANSVVEYVLAAIAASGTRLEQLLAGGCVGIVGFGVIGKAIGARLRALDIRYRVYDPWLAPAEVHNRASLAEILACDVVTLHAELTREQPWPSYHLLNAAALEQLNRSALLINASRGAVVDNLALLSLLRGGDGPDTVLDVWEGEPAINHALLQQVAVGTPHIAGYSLDGKLLATRMLWRAMVDHLGLGGAALASPAGEAAPIELDPGLAGAPMVRYLLRTRYDIGRDDAALRTATLGHERASAAVAFDQLRRDYPARRELLGSQVSGDFSSPRDLDLVKGLGCVPLVTGSAV